MDYLALDVLKKMLERDPKVRFTCKELMEEDILKDKSMSLSKVHSDIEEEPQEFVNIQSE